MSEATRVGGGGFILLADFWEGFHILEARHDSAESFIRTSIQQEMYEALANSVSKLTILATQELRDRAAATLRPDDFVVTLDGGIVFPAADFRIDITRAAESIQKSVSGPYMRVARGLAPQLRQQAINLRAAYAMDRRHITLCDDGIGTGTTIRNIIELLGQVGLTVERIITVTNPQRFEAIDGVPVTTLFPSDQEFAWLNERDLYWGLPRSGLSIHRPDQFVAIGGVPYTLSNSIAQNRIGLPPAMTPRFRRANLHLNKRFWSRLEELHGRPLTLRDCSRLQFFGEYLQVADMSIIELITLAEGGELLPKVGLDG
jgi:hypothetical protein